MYLGYGGGASAVASKAGEFGGSSEKNKNRKIEHEAGCSRGTGGRNTVSKVANSVTGVGASVAGFGWLTATEFAAICGALMAVLGFVVTLVYNHRRDRREQELHCLRMSKFNGFFDDST